MFSIKFTTSNTKYILLKVIAKKNNHLGPCRKIAEKKSLIKARSLWFCQRIRKPIALALLQLMNVTLFQYIHNFNSQCILKSHKVTKNILYTFMLSAKTYSELFIAKATNFVVSTVPVCILHIRESTWSFIITVFIVPTYGNEITLDSNYPHP